MNELPFGKPIMGREEFEAVQAVLESGTLVHGPKAGLFEERFAEFTGAPHAASVSSCTAGLHLAYFYKGIGPGDEVIVPAQTHVATAHAVELVGATPIFVDAESTTGNIDIEQIERYITPRTKAISVVHFLGMPVDMDRVCALAKKYNLFVLEDCALAIGSSLRGKHMGLFGDAGCFSFYPVKHMTTGEGGMLITKDQQLAETIRRQRAFGLDRHVGERKVPGMYDVTMLGFNYRMSEISAALGIEQLHRVHGFLAVRKENYEALQTRLEGLEGITLLQSSYGEFQSSYYCLSILLDESLVEKRFEIMAYLKERGVGASIYYPKPVPHMTYYKQKYGFDEGSFPVAKRISDSTISLPVGPHLTVADMETIATTVREAIISVRRSPVVPASTSLQGRRIALIGGAGFIGHNLALELVKQGAAVEVVDSLQVNNLLSIVGDNGNGNRQLYTKILNQRLQLLQDAGVPLHIQDARDYHALTRILKHMQPDTIVQMAAVSHANRSNKDPHSTFDHSLRTLENALDYARGNVEHFVYFSSSMVYGDFKVDRVTEDEPCEPLGIYGALKIAGEKIVIAYNQVFDLPYTIIRPSALYGERCVSRRVGQIFIENLMQGKVIEIEGDGSDRLDFTYVQDLIHGVMCVLKSPQAKNQTFNLTYGGARSIRDLATILQNHFPDVRVVYNPRDRFMPNRGTLSVEKAKNLIGYNPQYPLERGLLEYVNWYRELFA